LSAADSLYTAIVTGAFSIVGVIVGIFAAGELDARRRKQTKIERVTLYEHQAISVFHRLLNHVGINISKLSPIFAENLEGKSPNKEEIRKLVEDALEAFPFPEPDTLQFPKEDPSGYALIAISRTVGEYVQEANRSAQVLKSGNWDVASVSKFLVAADIAADKQNIINTAKVGYSEYMNSIEEFYGRKSSQKERDASMQKFILDLETLYEVAQKMGTSKDGYIRTTSEYLRSIGW
jgi:hypothetical protein